jgi:hypothetical protein
MIVATCYFLSLILFIKHILSSWDRVRICAGNKAYLVCALRSDSSNRHLTSSFAIFCFLYLIHACAQAHIHNQRHCPRVKSFSSSSFFLIHLMVGWITTTITITTITRCALHPSSAMRESRRKKASTYLSKNALKVLIPSDIVVSIMMISL